MANPEFRCNSPSRCLESDHDSKRRCMNGCLCPENRECRFPYDVKVVERKVVTVQQKGLF